MKLVAMGIDPGTAITGYGVIERDNEVWRAVDYGCIRTKAGLPLIERLHQINQGLEELLRRYSPDFVAVEELFFNTNAKTAIAVGQARGAILLTCALNSKPTVEYTPLQVKQAVAGYGRAEKQQVQKMVQMLLGLRDIPRPDDAADALAIAICGLHSYHYEQTIARMEDKR